MMLRKTHPLLSMLNSSLYNLPAPSNISHMWNMGSLLGACLLVQTVTGIFLAMHYSSSILLAFDCLSHIMRDVSSGWQTRLIHANGASLFFAALYIHIGRGLYFKSYQMNMTWSVGVIIFLMTMATAFLGYVLPWGQMSFWGATVITNLVSAIPYMGLSIVEWLWGGFSVNNATLTRFFSLHFTLPFVVMLMVMIHLIFLHEEKSNNPMGIMMSSDKIFFFPYFSSKDIVSFVFIMFIFSMMISTHPYILMDPDNFTPANPMVTPTHIQPEWYFLFAYAILRAIPNKLGGVLCLLMSILILLILPFKNNMTQNPKSSMMTQSFWWFFFMFLILTWLGMKPVEIPFTSVSSVMTFLYFYWFFL